MRPVRPATTPPAARPRPHPAVLQPGLPAKGLPAAGRTRFRNHRRPAPPAASRPRQATRHRGQNSRRPVGPNHLTTRKRAMPGLPQSSTGTHGRVPGQDCSSGEGLHFDPAWPGPLPNGRVDEPTRLSAGQVCARQCRGSQQDHRATSVQLARCAMGQSRLLGMPDRAAHSGVSRPSPDAQVIDEACEADCCLARPRYPRPTVYGRSCLPFLTRSKLETRSCSGLVPAPMTRPVTSRSAQNGLGLGRVRAELPAERLKGTLDRKRQDEQAGQCAPLVADAIGA
jgi:hypothetical protein